MNKHSKIVIAGAGSIGCFVGGLLHAGGQNVHFLARPRIQQEITEHGLLLTDYAGMTISTAGPALNFTHDPKLLENADAVLVTVKSGATPDIAALIREHCQPKTIVVSLQNGIRNAETLAGHLPGFDIRAGMVPFNVVHLGKGKFHRGTSGAIVVEEGLPDVSSTLQVPHLAVKAETNMQSVLWGKLLINLNNALNALSGKTLYEQLSDRDWRVLMAAQMREGLNVLKANQIPTNPPAPVPASVIPHILRLPTPLFRMVAKSMLAIDPQARSSMWEDLKIGRKTEIDELQGEIIRLGQQSGVPTQINERVMAHIREAESNNNGSPSLSPKQI